MRRYRAGVYNADNGRPIAGPKDIAELVRKHDLDLLAVVEAAGYARAVRRRIGSTHRVYTGHGSVSRADSMIIVKRGIPARWKRVHNLRTGGWERSPANRHHGLHPGRHMVSIKLGARGSRFRLGSLHLPPGPHDAKVAYRRRASAFANGLTTLKQIANRWRRWVIAGDWNASNNRGDIEQWLREVKGHAKGGGIDYPAWRGVKVHNVRRVPAGGDHHHAMLFNIYA